MFLKETIILTGVIYDQAKTSYEGKLTEAIVKISAFIRSSGYEHILISVLHQLWHEQEIWSLVTSKL